MLQPWFPAAKFGIFIHWGIYAVNGKDASWSFYNFNRQGMKQADQQSYADYMAQLGKFTADRYDPDAWADLFARAGARYAVLTTKHHDGVALWNTNQSGLSVPAKTPAARDLVAPWCVSMRKKGLKVGLYFSHLDWSHPDYPSVRNGGQPTMAESDPAYGYAFPKGPDDPARWERFLTFNRGQLQELCSRHRPDLLWFDGDWERTPEQWKMHELQEFLHRLHPTVVLNSRMGGHGDYDTPEQGIPIAPPRRPWEFCVTMNDQWGYTPNPDGYKSTHQLVRMLAECVGMGGNLLLNVSPKADGSIPTPQVERLEAIGAWTRTHAEAIYPTGPGLPPGHLYGASTISKDRQTIYAFVFDRPWHEFAIKGVRNRVKRISALGHDGDLAHRVVGGAPWAGIPGVLWIEVPERVLDPSATVLKIELEGPLDLYTGSGDAITAN